jgi:low affinity Fe/Cu permease
MKKNNKSKGFFDRFSQAVTKAAGSPYAFIVALTTVIVWAVLGPIFEFSDTWQLVINTGTTIITFLMVFVIQQSQNKDTMALQLKLNELLASQNRASNRLIDIEDLTEEELDKIKNYYIKLARLSADEDESLQSHTEQEATENHRRKEENKRDEAKK